MNQAGTRLDKVVVQKGLARSRTHAQQLIREGSVTVAGAVAARPSLVVHEGDEVALTGAGRADAGWVGRGAHKLVAALRAFPAVARAADGGRCLDVGASTGGFTQVLLAAGAREVVALDVGHGQLDPRIASDPRVLDLSGTNARHVSAGQLGRVDVLVCDVSFISLTLLAGTIADLLAPLAHAVLLVKPQFEVGRDHVGEGVVTDPRLWRAALSSVTGAARDAGLGVHGLVRSPVEGTRGNREFLLWVRPGAAPGGPLDDGVLEARTREVTSLTTG